MNTEQAIRKLYPQAKPLGELRDTMMEWLRATCGSVQENTLLATSCCADDILMTKDVGGHFSGPFIMGGLAGLPFGGTTALTAFLHHIPDQGVGLLVYGPHIGVNQSGTIGKVARPGQAHESACCGSLMGALKALQDPNFVAPDRTNWDEYNLEQTYLISRLADCRDQIVASAVPEQAVTDAAYDIGRDLLLKIIARCQSQFNGIRLVCIGGVMINTAPDEADWFDLRHTVVIDRETLL